MNAYTPPGWGAIHLDGCTLDPDHAGACLLARPFRIRPEGGREYLDHDDAPDDSAGQEVSAPHAGDGYVRCSVLNTSTPSAPRAGDGQGANDLHPAVNPSAPRDGDGQDDALPELTAESSVAEVGWVAREARALMSVDDPERRARFLTRKRRLLDFIEQRQTGGRP